MKIAKESFPPMKLLIVGSLIAQLIGAAPQATSQNSAPAQKLNLKIGSATIQADSIERPVRFPSIIQLKGNVQITTKIGVGDAPARLMIMMVRADEADYHEDTGEIEARGNVWMNYRDDPGDIKAGSVRIRLEKTNAK
jgi:lipopolysaccharide assembly outer membrane protein LptD (OstA)